MSNFFVSCKKEFSDATELAMRETIFGILRKGDTDHKNVVHTSDFRAAISNLGFTMGHPVVDEVLVHCKIDKHSGNIDFSSLEHELKKSRALFNKKKKDEVFASQVKTLSSSSAVKEEKLSHWANKAQQASRFV